LDVMDREFTEEVFNEFDEMEEKMREDSGAD
jgi:hypothetical protein